MKKAFTLIELVVAIAILALMTSFAGVIFKVCIESYRTSTANSEIMQKLRAISDQLNADFRGLRNDGYLILRSQNRSRPEFDNLPIATDFRADRIYYFCTGRFQSWFSSDVGSIDARVYLGHDAISTDGNVSQSKCRLARDAQLLTPGTAPPLPMVVDYNNVSYDDLKANRALVLSDADKLLFSSVEIDLQNDPNSIRSLMCQHTGAFEIDWTEGSKSPAGELIWWGLGNPSGLDGESPGPPYQAEWTPENRAPWPKGLRFTFTLYDSKGVIKGGRTFTHIVYLGG